MCRKAAALFAASGYHATTVDDIAAAVQLNKGTLYYYFPSKAAILFRICDDVVSEFTGAADRVPPDSTPAEGLEAILRAQLGLIAERSDEVSVFLQELRWLKEWLSPADYRTIRDKEQTFGDAMISLLEQGVSDGQFDGVDTTVASHNIMGMVAWASRWYQPRAGVDLDQVIDETVRFTFDGLGAKASVGR